MAFDVDMIKKVYERMAERVDNARDIVGRPLTLSEKILYNHLWDGLPKKSFERGVDYKLQSEMIERATELLLDIVGGDAGPVSEKVSAADLPSRELVELRYDRVESLLGLKVEKTEVEPALGIGHRFAEEQRKEQ